MKISYDFVEFHSPVFSQGKNHGSKVKASKDLELYYDTDLKFMCMVFKGKTTHFDSFHSGDVSIPVTIPHHASKEGKAMRALAAGAQGE